MWWLRPAAQAIFRIAFMFDTHNSAEPGKPRLHLATPLAPADGNRDQSEARILPAFCQGPMPLFHREDTGRLIVHTAKPSVVGRDGAATLCFGEVRHNCILPLDRDPQLISGISSRVPTELLVSEVYVHRDLVEQGFVFRPLLSDGLFLPTEVELCAPRIELSALDGTFATSEPTDEIESPVKTPRYRDLQEFVFESIGQVRRDFFCYRMRIEAPPLGLTVSLIAGQDPETYARDQIS